MVPSASEKDEKAPIVESVSAVKTSVASSKTDDSAISDKVTTGTSPPPQNMSTQVYIFNPIIRITELLIECNVIMFSDL